MDGSKGDRGSLKMRVARYGLNAGLVEELHQRFRVDPRSVDAAWAELFEADAAAERGLAEAPAPRSLRTPELLRPCAADAPSAASSNEPMLTANDVAQHARVLRLIHAYRARGHRIANSDPLGGNATYFPELDSAHYGLGH